MLEKDHFQLYSTGFITITLTCIVTIYILSPAGMSLHYDFFTIPQLFQLHVSARFKNI